MRHLRFISAVAVLCCAPSAALAGTVLTVEPIMVIEDGKEDASIEGTLWRRFEGSPFGFSGFWWVASGWAEIHVGPTFTPVEWLTLGADIGIEQNGNGGVSTRFATAFWINYKPFALSGMLELGEGVFQNDWSGAWYEVLATVAVGDVFTVGGRARRGVGLGPQLQFNLPLGKCESEDCTTPYLRLWALWAPLDPERIGTASANRFLLGATFEL